MKTEPAKALRILVTGGTGFLGKYVVRELKTAGHDVTETSKTMGYDLRNESEAMTCVWLARPDVVVHLARSPLHPSESPAFGFRDTLLMGMNVLHSAALARSKVVMVVPPGVDEEEIPNSEGEAKKALLSACKAYSRQFGIDSRILQFSELYGPFAKPQEHYLDVLSLINTFTLARLKGDKEVMLPGTGAENRQPLAVNDAAKAVAKACIIGPIEDMVVMTGMDVVTEKTLADAVFKACRFEGTYQWDGEKTPYSPPPLLDGGNSEEILEVVAETPLEQVLGAMVAIRMEGLPVVPTGEEEQA